MKEIRVWRNGVIKGLDPEDDEKRPTYDSNGPWVVNMTDRSVYRVPVTGMADSRTVGQFALLHAKDTDGKTVVVAFDPEFSSYKRRRGIVVPTDRWAMTPMWQCLLRSFPTKEDAMAQAAKKYEVVPLNVDGWSGVQVHGVVPGKTEAKRAKYVSYRYLSPVTGVRLRAYEGMDFTDYPFDKANLGHNVGSLSVTLNPNGSIHVIIFANEKGWMAALSRTFAYEDLEEHISL